MIGKIEEDENGTFLVFPEGVTEEVGWKPGDNINWIDNNDESWTLKKVEKETEYVLVDEIQLFRVRYVIEVPEGQGIPAIETDKCKEFSQLFLGGTISSVTSIDKEDIIPLCDVDNEYTKEWDTEHKMKTFVTTKKEYDD